LAVSVPALNGLDVVSIQLDKIMPTDHSHLLLLV